MRLPILASVVISGSFLFACGSPDRGDDGGDDDMGSGSGTDGGGSNVDNCTDAAKLVYVVDSNNQLSTFDPATKMFHDLGNLSCPAETDILGIPATPFSMGIDRNANAWVLYSSSELMQVNTMSLACSKAAFTPPSGLSLFGMGFSTDAAGGSADTLYIAGSDAVGTATTSKLASLNTTTMAVTQLGTVTGNPELTGTGSAELWGFFPSDTGSSVKKIDKATGAALTTYNSLTALNGTPSAWAFAFWGGDFWVFLQKDTDTATKVYQIDSTTGALKGTTTTNGRSIVGAGVSTCAPVVIL